MTLGSLFAGIGGFELAATWAGIEPVWSNEIDKFACKVLRKNFDHEIIQEDIREIGAHNLRSVDIISGGFPCQPFSQAGKRKGKSDDRYLWPEMLRVISELKPSYIIGENVAGLLSMENGETLKGILSDLENEGYNNEIFIIPACGVQAWHRRDRIWIVSTRNDIYTSYTDSNSQRPYRQKVQQPGKTELRNKQISISEGLGKNVSNSKSEGFQKRKIKKSQKDKSGIRLKCIYTSQGGAIENWSTEPELDRVANGIPNRVDRIKGLGNAIVPQVAYEIFKTIAHLCED